MFTIQKEHFKQPSMTVPGQSFTLPYLLERARRNQPVHLGTSPAFDYDFNPDDANGGDLDPDGEPDPLNTFGLDINEVEELKQQTVQNVKSRAAAAKKRKDDVTPPPVQQDTPPQGV